MKQDVGDLLAAAACRVLKGAGDEDIDGVAGKHETARSGYIAHAYGDGPHFWGQDCRHRRPPAFTGELGGQYRFAGLDLPEDDAAFAEGGQLDGIAESAGRYGIGGPVDHADLFGGYCGTKWQWYSSNNDFRHTTVHLLHLFGAGQIGIGDKNGCKTQHYR
ncbi:hypothetical protein GCM10019071_25830 [Sphingobium fuliginis]|uniref:Uncharacterized protein n=1 Tax=Sphingobium fuliginis (strain ATCC 27551) TaxID=336203 RepID=A0ABQ1EZA6_SPHSA|nr:hypothetical protein GCM10019071_25830 [Sphingobium fuliginis]